MFNSLRRSRSAMDLVHRYPFVVDERRSRELADLWACDATLVLPDGTRVVGRDEVVRYYLRLWGRLTDLAPTVEHPGLRHHITNVRLERSGRLVRATSYFVAVSRHGADHWGIYRDLIRTGRNQARFSERVIDLTGRVAASVIDEPDPATRSDRASAG